MGDVRPEQVWFEKADQDLEMARRALEKNPENPENPDSDNCGDLPTKMGGGQENGCFDD